MKANEKSLVRFLEGTDKTFVIPIYQRNYDWKKENCQQLFEDLIDIINNNYRSHFFGSIVYIYDEDSDNQQHIIIDGQQRITTVSLLLLAIYNLIDNGVFEDKNNLLEKIRNEYLVDKYKPTDKKVKLKLSKNDKLAFDRLFEKSEEYFITNSNITVNYLYFYNWIQERIKNIADLVEAIKKLMIVSIKLSSTEDDPQLIFESLNSTGLDLNEADKMRNFILMGLDVDSQNKLYDKYWVKIEELTQNIDAFARDYLTIKTQKIPNSKKIYAEFKQYVINNRHSAESILSDMYRYAKYYHCILKANTGISAIDDHLMRINKLESTVTYPYLLLLFDNYYEYQILTDDDVGEVLLYIESYLMRRTICNVPTNALNKVFLILEKEIEKIDGWETNYINIFKYILKIKTVSQRFPDNTEFGEFFRKRDAYNMHAKKKLVLLERLENYNNVETVDVENLLNEGKLTIEHIMPQELSLTWKNQLGDKYEEIHQKYLHTIGNLTLTGYNSKLSNRAFEEKRDMEDGFKSSRLYLNKYIAEQEQWDDKTISARAKMLLTKALKIWPYVSTDFVPEKDIEFFHPLSDTENISFTNKSIAGYEFFGDEFKTNSWTDFYEQIIAKLYDYDKVEFTRLINHTFSDSYMNKRFSESPNNLRTALKIADNAYVEKNLNTDAKLQTLRVICEFYKFDLDDIGFYLTKPSENND